jgi:PAS domain S-box-containing protein
MATERKNKPILKPALHEDGKATAASKTKLQQNGETDSFQSILDHLPDPVIRFNKNLQFVFANQAFLKIVKHELKDITGKTNYEIGTPQHIADSCTKFLTKIFDTGKPADIDTYYMEGEDFKYITIKAVPEFDEKGKAVTVLAIGRDITERKKIEWIIKEERRRNQEAEELGHIGSFEWNLLTDVITWSDEMYRIHGLTPGEKISLDLVFSLIHPDDLAELKEKKFQCKKEPCSITITHRLIRPDGETRIVNRQLRSFADERGKITHITGSVQDITEQKKAEQAISDQAHFISHITKMLPDVITVTEVPSRRIIYCNNENLASHGFDLDELRKMTYEERRKMIHPDDASAVDDYFNSFLETTPDEEIHTLEYRAINKRGELMTFIARGKVFDRNPDGTVRCIVNVLQDISEKKKKEDEILRLKDELAKQAEAKYRTIFNSIEEGLALCELVRDEDGNPIDYRIIEINPLFKKFPGTPEQLSGRLRSEIEPPMSSEMFERFVHVVETGEPFLLEQYNKENDLWNDLGVFYCKGDLFVQVYNDITERKRQERHQAFLSEISQELTTLNNINDTIDIIGKKIGNYFEVKWCMFSEVTDARTAVVSQGWNADDVKSLKGTYQMQDFLSEEQVAKNNSGKPTVVNDTETDPRVNAENFKSLGVRSLIITPHVRNSVWNFMISVIDNKPRIWREDEVILIKEVTSRIWVRLEKARAENALRKSEVKFRTLFESIDEGYCLIKVIFNEKGDAVDWLYLEANPTFERQSGFNPIGKKISELVPHVEDFWLSFYGNVVKTGKAARTESQFAALNSWFSTYASPVEKTSDLVAVVLDDITIRKEAEIVLSQSKDQLTQLNTTLEHQVIERTAELRHFNTITANNYTEALRHVYIYLETIVKTDSRTLSNSSRANLRRAQSAIQKMKLLTNDINNYLKLYEAPIQKEIINTNLVLEKVVDKMKNKIAELNAAVEIGDLPPIAADSELFSKLMTNLIDNAIKFCEQPKKPLVKIYTLPPSAIKEIPDEVRDIPFTCIVVSDNGVGFESSERIFELFVQLQDQTKQRGAGLGLSVCKKIMNMHRGAITAEGKPGEGATFNCFFPA